MTIAISNSGIIHRDDKILRMKIRGGWIVDTVNGYASKTLLPNLSYVAKNDILIVTFSHSCYENYLHAALFHLLLLNLFLTYFYTSYFLYIFHDFISFLYFLFIVRRISCIPDFLFYTFFTLLPLFFILGVLRSDCYISSILLPYNTTSHRTLHSNVYY